jgi:hypothetical protein
MMIWLTSSLPPRINQYLPLSRRSDQRGQVLVTPSSVIQLAGCKPTLSLEPVARPSRLTNS